MSHDQNTVQQFQQDWDSLTGALDTLGMGWTPGALTPVKLEHVKSHRYDVLSLSDIEGITELNQLDGWILANDKLYTLPDGLPENLENIQILQMEARKGNQHWQVVYLGETGWLLNRFRCHTCGSESELSLEDTTHMAENVQHIAEKGKGLPDNTRLNYLKLWNINELPQFSAENTDNTLPMMPMPEVALFNGFQSGSDTTKDKE